MRLYRYQNRISRHERIDRNHSERRHAIDQNEVIRILDHLNVPFQNGLPRQCVDERYFQRRQRDICRYKINPFRMMQDTFKRIELFVFDQAVHVVPNRNGQFIRLMPTERIRQVPLCIGVDEQHLVALPDKTCSKVHRRCRFPYSTLLVCDCDYFCHFDSASNSLIMRSIICSVVYSFGKYGRKVLSENDTLFCVGVSSKNSLRMRSKHCCHDRKQQDLLNQLV